MGAIGAVFLSACGGSHRPQAIASRPLIVSVSGRPLGKPIPAGFLGLSFEYQGTRHYTGTDPRAVDPVLVQLIRNLTPGQAPVLRIGGDSTDAAWRPTAGAEQPPWVKFRLTDVWIKTTRALARELGAHLILGVNLAADSRAIARAEARALVNGIGRRYVEALELGNEPEVYGRLPWYARGGRRVYARPSSYGLAAYVRDVETLRTALPSVPLAGPATGGLAQLRQLGAVLSALPQLRIVTFHRYPSNRCYPSADSPVPATIPGLLSKQASRGLMDGATPYVTLAHREGAQFRVDELNTIACAGKVGVSDTFASALWAADALFAFARAGLDGVNVHTFPRAGYSLFLITHPGGRWQASVHPEYYGLLLFARAAPPRSRLLSVRVGGGGDVRVWATRTSRGTVRVLLIDDSRTQARRVFLRLPPSLARAIARRRRSSARVTLERLLAPAAGAPSGVTLAGQSFGPATRTGRLTGRMQISVLTPTVRGYSLVLPAGSAALITAAIR